MKCDLCQHRVAKESQLCGTCADMIRRLVAIDHRLKARQNCEAERLALVSLETQSTASGLG